MYNRENFNRGKFNTSSASLAVTGVARLALTGEVGCGFGLSAPQSSTVIQLNVAGWSGKRFHAPTSAVDMVLGTMAKPTRRLYSARVAAATALGLTGTARRMVFAVASMADMRLNGNARGKRRFFMSASAAPMSLFVAGSSTRCVSAVASDVIMSLVTAGRGTRRFTAKSEPIPIALNTKGAVTMLGYATIALPGLVIPPGGDLVIDTEMMTVTLNGDDVTRFFSAESEFFRLKPGDNVIIFEDGVQNRNISTKILWKDMWL